MKKILGLLLVSSSLFSMRMDIIKSPAKVKMIQEKFTQKMNKLERPQVIAIFAPSKDESNKMRIESRSVFVPHQLESAELYHDKNGFSVNHYDKTHRIQKCFVDKLVRNMDKNELKAFLSNGYLSLNETTDGSFLLNATVKENGGGPIFGAFMYGATKAVCYGVILAAIGTIVASGGAIGVGTLAKKRAIGAAQHVSVDGLKLGTLWAAETATVPLTSSIVVTTGAKIISTIPMGVSASGAGLVSTAITGAGLAGEATVVACAGAMSTSGTGLGVAASIELLALKVGLFCGMTPTI